jgi:hypothetical protein
MSACDQIRPQLSGYVDRHLDRAEAAEVRAHLLSCDTCRGIADDLGLIRDAARSLGRIDPPAHVWLEIAGRVRLDGGVPAVSSATPAVAPARPRSEKWQWLGLAAALLLTTLAVYSITKTDTTAPASVATATPGNVPEVATVETFDETMKRAEAEFEKAIAQLEQLLKNGDPRVSAAAAATLQKSIPTIDSAIAESRAAVSSSPDSQPARTSLFEALRNKVNLLQHTVVLMNVMRKGDAGGAAEAAAGLGKGES